MRRVWKVLRVVLIVLLVIIIAAPLGGWLLLRRSLPRISGTDRVAGLNGPVQIVRDSHGIPYITAATDHDAFFALGYVHAQDRLWQMEMQRRIGAGRLSEVLGKATVKTDQFLRTLGVYRAAVAAWPALAPESQAALRAYADGINAYLAEGRPLPPEFVILGFKPEPWQPTDSLVWAKMMAWNLGDTYGDDLVRGQLAAALGPERAAQLMPGYPAAAPVILPPDAMAGDLRDLDNVLRDTLGLGDKRNGSNNWVVSGARTASGKPLLANDPHLGAQIPAIWYLAGIQGDKIHAVGATLPGLPAVVIGHNAEIAWGVTNLGPDVQDLYAERINPANPDQYEVNGGWVDMQIAAEEIKVKGEKKPVKWAARATRNGPLISDVTDERGHAPGAALDLARPRRHDDGCVPGHQLCDELGRFHRRAARLLRPVAELRLRRPRGQHRLLRARATSPCAPRGTAQCPCRDGTTSTPGPAGSRSSNCRTSTTRRMAS